MNDAITMVYHERFTMACLYISHHLDDPLSLDTLSHSVWAMFRNWLPGSNETLRDAPVFFHYLNFVNDVYEHELQTDIYLPLK